MTTVLLFHHAQGQTRGFLDFAERLRGAGHTVHTPDLFGGKTFSSLDEGIAYAKEMGFEEFVQRGVAAATELPNDIVYAGFSLGVMPAQSLAQNRAGAGGALFYSACMPPSELGGPWPTAVPLQIHMMTDDPWGDEDLLVARALADEADAVELFEYPGDGHLFADASLDDHDPEAAALLTQRSLDFLEHVG